MLLGALNQEILPVYLRSFGLFLVLGMLLGVAGSAMAQPRPSEFYEAPETPQEFWRALRFETSVGNYELAARYLRQFLASKPNEDVYLELLGEKGPDADRTGLAPFLALRNVPTWSVDPELQKEAKQNVETVIAQATVALRNFLGNPKRLARLVQQLIASPEEQIYAEQELRRAGVAAIPILLDTLQFEPNNELRRNILLLLPSLDESTVPATLAFLDTTNLRLRLGVLDALAQRRDILALSGRPETDLRPTLWYYASLPGPDPNLLRDRARSLLANLFGKDPAGCDPVQVLLSFSRSLYDGKANFANPDQIPVWRYTAATRQLIPPPDQPPFYTASRAAEYFGLRYARWALERSADPTAAQVLFLSLALDGAFQRAPLDSFLIQTSPEVYRLAATAPLEILLHTLAAALTAERTPVALGALQVLSERRSDLAGLPYACPGPNGKQIVSESLLAQALNYKPDFRIRFYAAVTLLRIPEPLPNVPRTRVLEVLRQALLAQPNDVPTALLADPDLVRLRSVEKLLGQLGYRVVTARTGKQLLRRLQHEGLQPDLVVIDRYLAYPPLPDLLANLRQDARFAALPLLLMASRDVSTLTFPIEGADRITLFLRLGVLVAATDPVDFPADKILNPEFLQDAQVRLENEQLLDRINQTLQERLDRLRRLVASTGIELSRPVEKKLEYLTLLVAAEDFPLPALPKARLESLRVSPDVVTPVVIPFAEQIDRRLINLVAQIDEEISPAIQKRVDALRTTLDTTLSRTATTGPRDLRNELRLQTLAEPYDRIRVIAEPFAAQALAGEIAALQASPEATPSLSPAAQRYYTLIALGLLGEMASGKIPCYQVELLEAEVRQQSRAPEEGVVNLALEVLQYIGIPECQWELARVSADVNRPAALRVNATAGLIGHIQRFGMLLRPEQVALIQQQLPSIQDRVLRGRLEVLLGIVTPSEQSTREQMEVYTPPPPMPAAPPMPPKQDPNQPASPPVNPS